MLPYPDHVINFAVQAIEDLVDHDGRCDAELLSRFRTAQGSLRSIEHRWSRFPSIVEASGEEAASFLRENRSSFSPTLVEKIDSFDFARKSENLDHHDRATRFDQTRELLAQAVDEVFPGSSEKSTASDAVVTRLVELLRAHSARLRFTVEWRPS